MKRLAFLFAGLLLVIAPVLAGCSQAENAIETTTTAITTTTTTAATTTTATTPTSSATQTTTTTTTSVSTPAEVSSCVGCHTDKAKLIANSPEETTAEAESSGEG